MPLQAVSLKTAVVDPMGVRPVESGHWGVKRAPLSGPRQPGDLRRAGRDSAAAGPTREMSISQKTSIRSSVQYLKGVGPKFAELLARAGVETIEDLLYYVPRGYTDWSTVAEIDKLRVGDRVTVVGQILSTDLSRRRGGRSVMLAVVEDETGAIVARWYNQPYLGNTLRKGGRIVLSGEVRFDKHARRKEFVSPSFELMGDREVAELVHAGRIVPEYSQIGDLSGKRIRRFIKSAMDAHLAELVDPLPGWVVKRRRLPDLKRAIADVHFTNDTTRAAVARGRLAYEEFFLFQIIVGVRRQRRRSAPRAVAPLEWSETEHERFLDALPFALTGAQARSIDEMRRDLEHGAAMNRLLQGDVGSGKTAVAAAAMHQAAVNGWQSALMAPTEILARQHHENIASLLEPLGHSVALLRGGMRAEEKATALDAIRSGASNIIVGTHALIQEGVTFANLGLVVIDEQHRFGVVQRAALRQKGGAPDVLVMTATPIPRTLSLTVYGDLDISVIDELPPGRSPVRTAVRDEAARGRVYDFLRQEVGEGRQVFIVYPLVEQSDKMDLAAATKMHKQLDRKIFPEVAVGLVHGRMRAEEKNAVMRAFADGEISILVSTTVIEVGVDVPNATVMVVEHAERFGLAQLHQLRGRVGRGSHQSYCILMAGPAASDDARERLKVLAETNDGFVIAERDLQFRGPGEFMGVRQHGLPRFSVADLVADTQLLVRAREDAFELIERDPELNEPESRTVVSAVERRFHGQGDLMEVG